jgi:GNAT superfamily N-acetyltransferase
MIYFRQVDEPRIGKGIFWHVEFYSTEGSAFPVGTAYVESPPSAPPVLRFMLVADQWRSRGIATRLVAACVEKWPNIEFTTPISRTGEKAVNRAVRNQNRPLPDTGGLQLL